MGQRAPEDWQRDFEELRCKAARRRERTGDFLAGLKPFGALDSSLEKTRYALVDDPEAVAKAHASTVARMALAPVQSRPGVASTVIGPRRLSQLEDNVAALDLELTPAEVAYLEELTRPTLGLPQNLAWFFPRRPEPT